MKYSEFPLLFKDFYKVDHIRQYPKGTTLIFSNLTARKSLVEGVDYVVFFGLQYFIKKYLIESFNENFFHRPVHEVAYQYQKFISETLRIDIDLKPIIAFHKLGYLPLYIYSLSEGTKVPIGCPCLVIANSHPEFYWVTNMIETLLSCTLWGACTSATTANRFRELLDRYAKETSDIPEFVDYQAHDFSFRGMFGLEAAAISGAAHLQYFKGTDSMIAIALLNDYYYKHLSVGTSVAATEHSVMCAGGKENELATYRRLITEIYPSGTVSIVSDTWDFWNVIDNYLPELKDEILARDGCVVIRPDSGDPLKILCGDLNAATESESKGLIR